MSDPEGALADEELAALNELNERAVNAINDGDLDAFIELWTDDAVVMRPHEPARIGKRAIRAGQQAFFESYTAEDRAFVEEIVIEGNYAFERGSYLIRLSPIEGGEPLQDKGKYLLIHQRQPDGSWLFWRYIFNSDYPTAWLGGDWL